MQYDKVYHLAMMCLARHVLNRYIKLSSKIPVQLQITTIPKLSDRSVSLQKYKYLLFYYHFMAYHTSNHLYVLSFFCRKSQGIREGLTKARVYPCTVFGSKKITYNSSISVCINLSYFILLDVI